MSETENARFVRRTGITLAAMLLAFPVGLWGTFQGLRRLNDDAISWTASDLAARRDLEWFTEHFGSYNAVLVSWPGATLSDPRMQRFAEAFRELAADGGQSGRLFREVVTGADVYEELTSERLDRSHRQAIRRMQGMFIGPDGRTSCAVVVLSEDAALDARRAVETIRTVADRQCGVGRDDLRMVGYVVETATLDAAALDTLLWLSIPSAALVILIAWPCVRSLRLAMLVWAVATFCQCSCLATAYFHSGQINGMMTVLPILIMVIFVSSAVHLINYYQDALEEVGREAATKQAMATGWFPCSLAVVTSAIGVGSLALSRTEPVRSFGAYAAVGAVFGLVILLAVLPGGMHLTLGKGNGGRRRPPSKTWWSWDPLASLVGRHSAPILFVCLGASIFGGFGLTRMQGSMQLTDFLSENSRIAQDHHWFQENVGPLLPVEIVLRFGRDSTFSMVERLDLVDQIEGAVAAMPQPSATVSLGAFLPSPDNSGSARSTALRAVLNRQLEKERAVLASASPYLDQAGEEELWRVTARLEGLNELRYEDMVAGLQRAVAPVIRAAQQRPGHDLSVVYTGTLPLLAACHPTLIRDLIVSFSVSLALIAVVLLVGLRSVRLGLVSILPNVFPMILVFGTLGWLGRSIDVGSMMTASVGLGIAVDGTVHYLTWFMRGAHGGLSRQASIQSAYRHCGAAMLRTTAICGAGLALFGVSSFLPAARFGWIVCALLLAALAGDLILLPALLSGWFGGLLFPGREGVPAARRDGKATPPSAVPEVARSSGADYNGIA